jgi:hypothetical protein
MVKLTQDGRAVEVPSDVTFRETDCRPSVTWSPMPATRPGIGPGLRHNWEQASAAGDERFVRRHSAFLTDAAGRLLVSDLCEVR